MRPENALISRRMFKVGDGTVIVEEVWDTKHADCPFVALPGALVPNPGLRQVRMTENEFEDLDPPLKGC